MRPAQRNDAGTGVARRIAPDIGETPFVADTLAVWKETGHPCFCGLAQSLDNQVQIVARSDCIGRGDIVEIDHNGAHWNTFGGTTPPNQLRSLRMAMNPKPGPLCFGFGTIQRSSPAS